MLPFLHLRGNIIVVQRNIVYVKGNCGPSFHHYGKDATDSLMQVDYNLIVFRDDPGKGKAVIQVSMEQGNEEHSICEDPCFVDAGRGDFRLRSIRRPSPGWASFRWNGIIWD